MRICSTQQGQVLGTFSHSKISQRCGNWVLISITMHAFLASSVPENSRSTMKRSLSESSILSEGSTAGRHGLAENDEEGKGLSDSAPEISTSETAMIAASLSAPPPTLRK
ncbi:hypothetical protein Bca52824_066585 [Brassica carinata]|uniref:Uncharacterized protein n=1 Tax=Brassica carinata TaxID=52824 RepID=A0A8X7QKH7_BRACI|nr:hypothetical protein Bca52824_066585 [Brassica carinata]